MRSFAKAFTTFAMTALAFMAVAGGCSHIGEAIDCDQMCNKLKTCSDGDLDVHDCAERCEDRVEDNSMSDKLDACTDCLDRGYSCSEVADECAVCDEVQMALAD